MQSWVGHLPVDTNRLQSFIFYNIAAMFNKQWKRLNK